MVKHTNRYKLQPGDITTIILTHGGNSMIEENDVYKIKNEYFFSKNKGILINVDRPFVDERSFHSFIKLGKTATLVFALIDGKHTIS